MNPSFSFIVPVFDRPAELNELLESLKVQTYRNFEVIVAEDGSSVRSEAVVQSYAETITLRYLDLPRSGPSLARNRAMEVAKGDYLLFVDSDCILPANYLERLNDFLQDTPLDLFGGPDRAAEDFNNRQKAISFAMTSFLTTGGIRGGKKKIDRFYPRSFNMGISRKAYESLGGFPITRMHPGEDMVFSIELMRKGFGSGLIPCSPVWHKRRTSFKKFFRQVWGFGFTRHIISRVYPDTFRLYYLFPSLFILGSGLLVMLSILTGMIWPLIPIAAWISLILLDSWIRGRDFVVAILSVWASLIQMSGYGLGFLTAFAESRILGKDRFGVFKDGFYPKPGSEL